MVNISEARQLQNFDGGLWTRAGRELKVPTDKKNRVVRRNMTAADALEGTNNYTAGTFTYEQ